MKQTLILFSLILLATCKPKDVINLEYFSFETECLGIERDGSQTLRAWGRGKDNKDAIDQAKINALNDVIFNGIRKGNGGCEMIPLVVSANARETHEEYFNRFFGKERLYSKYTSYKDGKVREKYKSNDEVVYSVTLRVERMKLKEKLYQDGIIISP